MFKHILVPLDGSARAEQALPVAARLAQTSEGTILLVTVVNTTQETMAYGLEGAFIPPDACGTSLADGQSYLSQLTQRASLTGAAAVEQQVVAGNPAEKILQLVEEQPIDLIVMSSHGNTGVLRRPLSSVTEKVVPHAPVPVLIMRDGDPLHVHLRADDSTVLRALVPLDVAAHELDAILPIAEVVVALSSPGKGVLHLLQMMIPPEEESSNEKEALLHTAREKLDAFGQEIRAIVQEHFPSALRPHVTWSMSLDSDIAEGIARVAEDGEETPEAGRVEHCDLIAMTTHHFKGRQQWVTGSITDRVLHATRLPLLIVRPAEIIARERNTKQTTFQTGARAGNR